MLFTIADLNYLAEKIHEANVEVGWYTDMETGEPLDREWEEVVSLIHSEISEALEGERKNLMDDKLPHRRMAEVEMADALIRTLDAAGWQRVVFTLSTVEFPKPIRKTKGGDILYLHSLIQGLENHQTYPKAFLNVVRGIEWYCQKHGHDLKTAMQEKIAFNRDRADHKIENRKLEGGKKF